MPTSISSRFMRPAHPDRRGKAAAWLRFVVLLALTAATAQIASAQIAAGTTGIDNTGNAKSEMGACMSGKSQQDLATCMTEVGNAGAARQAGKLGDGTDYSANALRRCDVFKEADDQAACKARILGENKAQGGVAGGGVLRETQTAVPAPAQ